MGIESSIGYHVRDHMCTGTSSGVASLHKVAGHNLGLPIWLVSGRCSPKDQDFTIGTQLPNISILVTLLLFTLFTFKNKVHCNLMNM